MGSNAYKNARLLNTNNNKWFYPANDELPEEKRYVYAIYCKARQDGIYYGDSKFYYCGAGQFEFYESSTVLLPLEILAWQYTEK